MNNIMVSINCITYNHEKYIAQAIESFLMQKTNFDFEILIHDDASTDNTQKIIKQYESLHPEKIKVIYQKENQYSKGIKASTINLPRAQGKYIALCEGDDYWEDALKLQKQVDFMEQNPDCSLCVHGGYLEKLGNRTEFKVKNTNMYVPTEEVIAGGGWLFLTNSMLYRREYRNGMPDFFGNCSIGDYPLAVHLALQGKVFYFKDLMSVYRLEAEGSWTTRIVNNKEKSIAHYQEMLEVLAQLDKYTNYHYKAAVQKLENHYIYTIHLVKKEYREIKSNREIYSALSTKEKVRTNLELYAPWLLKLYFKARRANYK